MFLLLIGPHLLLPHTTWRLSRLRNSISKFSLAQFNIRQIGSITDDTVVCTTYYDYMGLYATAEELEYYDSCNHDCAHCSHSEECLGDEYDDCDCEDCCDDECDDDCCCGEDHHHHHDHCDCGDDCDCDNDCDCGCHDHTHDHKECNCSHDHEHKHDCKCGENDKENHKCKCGEEGKKKGNCKNKK